MTLIQKTHRLKITPILPGLALTVGCAALASVAARSAPFLSSYQMILSIGLGVLIGNLAPMPQSVQAGVAFSLRHILRFAIVLLGLQITWRQAASEGVYGAAAIAATILATFVFAIFAGRALKVSKGLSVLIGVGTAICGASAVLAAKAAVRGEDEDAAYAVACVTLYGSVAIVVYPMLSALLGLDARHFGFWAGDAIHEIAQVIAAAYQHGPDALQVGTVAKLTRVAMMAPFIILLGEFGRFAGLSSSKDGERPPFPWFLVGFLAMMGFASLLSEAQTDSRIINATLNWLRDQSLGLKTLTTFLLSVSMTAMGAQTKLKHIRGEGLGPLLLGLLTSIFIGAFGLGASILFA